MRFVYRNEVRIKGYFSFNYKGEEIFRIQRSD